MKASLIYILIIHIVWFSYCENKKLCFLCLKMLGIWDWPDKTNLITSRWYDDQYSIVKCSNTRSIVFCSHNMKIKRCEWSVYILDLLSLFLILFHTKLKHIVLCKEKPLHVSYRTSFLSELQETSIRMPTRTSASNIYQFPKVAIERILCEH
jgi:hypothetical protein